MSTHDVYTLPPNLPAPEDDGVADRLVGLELAELVLGSSAGPVEVRSQVIRWLRSR